MMLIIGLTIIVINEKRKRLEDVNGNYRNEKKYLYHIVGLVKNINQEC